LPPHHQCRNTFLNVLKLVIPLAFELKEAEAVAEGIVKQGEAAVGVLAWRSLDYGTGGHCAGKGCVEIRDDEVEVERRPVPSIVARLPSSLEGRAAAGLEQQVNRSFCPKQLDEAGIETPPDAELERGRVERDCALDIVDVEID
jgi:hypothetical protein